MPIKGKWFKELIKSIENKNHKNWVDAIILKINFEELNAFSEYEMIGTFVEKNYKTQSMTKGVETTESLFNQMNNSKKASNEYIISNLRMSICELG